MAKQPGSPHWDAQYTLYRSTPARNGATDTLVSVGEVRFKGNNDIAAAAEQALAAAMAGEQLAKPVGELEDVEIRLDALVRHPDGESPSLFAVGRKICQAVSTLQTGTSDAEVKQALAADIGQFTRLLSGATLSSHDV